MALVDGLKGFPEVITAVIPDWVVQTCIVHLVRYSIQLAFCKEHKVLARALLRPFYASANAKAAAVALNEFEQGPGSQKYSAIVASWRRRWAAVIPFYTFSSGVRRILYITNAIESLRSRVRKAVRNKRHPPSEAAATTVIFLVRRKIIAKWKRHQKNCMLPTPDWRSSSAADP